MASKAVSAKNTVADIKSSLLSSISTSLESTLSGSFETLKEKLAGAIGDNGEKYLKDAVEKVTDSATHLAKWAKKNPVKTTVAAAGLIAVSAYLYSLSRSHAKDAADEGVAAAKKPAMKKARASA
ncbi:MAG: hypothetical protein H0X38_05215 [Planctomycetes bacterium]|nr:hypothetical protein [Planctomycetota bacterium]